ncbi:YggS family pyridoxal phosphate enzyme [Leptolyngbya sp. 15MV]|nr:YggS family pyridoxal phosphate enzyme [Leptolyngbya sp. 15MV]
MEMADTPLARVRAGIARACKAARRDPGDVTLIAVSKTQGPAAIEPLLREGQRVFGENRVQEAADKWPPLREAHPAVQLHLVGQLQSNKADEAVALFDAIHALDRPSLVAALARAMDKAGRQVQCFVQVNLGEEPQKGGCLPAELPALMAEASGADIPLSSWRRPMRSSTAAGPG